MRKKWIFSIMIIILLLSTIVYGVDDPINAMAGVDGRSDQLSRIGSSIYGILLAVTGVAAVVILAVLAIKFFTAAPGEKAEVKKNLVGFAVGLLIVITAVTLLEIFQSLGQRINDVV